MARLNSRTNACCQPTNHAMNDSARDCPGTPEEGAIVRGLIVEIYFDEGITRPRVRPVPDAPVPSWMRVEFSRDLRNGRQEGARFRIDAKVAQKHYADGASKGQPYLVADKSSIHLL